MSEEKNNEASPVDELKAMQEQQAHHSQIPSAWRLEYVTPKDDPGQQAYMGNAFYPFAENLLTGVDLPPETQYQNVRQRRAQMQSSLLSAAERHHSQWFQTHLPATQSLNKNKDSMAWGYTCRETLDTQEGNSLAKWQYGKMRPAVFSKADDGTLPYAVNMQSVPRQIKQNHLMFENGYENLALLREYAERFGSEKGDLRANSESSLLEPENAKYLEAIFHLVFKLHSSLDPDAPSQLLLSGEALKDRKIVNMNDSFNYFPEVFARLINPRAFALGNDHQWDKGWPVIFDAICAKALNYKEESWDKLKYPEQGDFHIGSGGNYQRIVRIEHLPLEKIAVLLGLSAKRLGVEPPGVGNEQDRKEQATELAGKMDRWIANMFAMKAVNMLKDKTDLPEEQTKDYDPEYFGKIYTSEFVLSTDDQEWLLKEYPQFLKSKVGKDNLLPIEVTTLLHFMTGQETAEKLGTTVDEVAEIYNRDKPKELQIPPGTLKDTTLADNTFQKERESAFQQRKSSSLSLVNMGNFGGVEEIGSRQFLKEIIEQAEERNEKAPFAGFSP
jgi:hypothetical protein